MKIFQLSLDKIHGIIIDSLSKTHTKIMTDFYKKYMILIGSLGHGLFLMQTHKIFHTGSAHDLSLPGFIVALIALLSWLFYGVLIKDKVLYIVNIVGALCALTTVIAIVVAQS